MFPPIAHFVPPHCRMRSDLTGELADFRREVGPDVGEQLVLCMAKCASVVHHANQAKRGTGLIERSRPGNRNTGNNTQFQLFGFNNLRLVYIVCTVI